MENLTQKFPEKKEGEPAPEIIDLSEDFLAGMTFPDRIYELKRAWRESGEKPKLIITVDLYSIDDPETIRRTVIRLKAFLENSDIRGFKKSALVRITKEQYENTPGAHNAFASGVKYEIVG